MSDQEKESSNQLVSTNKQAGALALRSQEDVVLKPQYEAGTVGALISAADLPLPAHNVAKKRVMTEDDFEDAVGDIIERDYYPHVKKMRAQIEYLEAKGQNDVERMREISMRYMRSTQAPPNATNTPVMPFTPSAMGATPAGRTPASGAFAHNPEGEETSKQTPSKESLTSFLHKHTSEDDASFAVLMAKSHKQHMEKHAWVYEQEEKAKQKILAITEAQSRPKEVLAIENGEQTQVQEKADTGETRPVEGWGYKAKNSLMFYSDSTESVRTKEQLLKADTKQIRFENTRLKENPFKAPLPVKRNEQGVRVTVTDVTRGDPRINVMGHEKVSATPQVNGYGFVATPSPAPGVEASPLMTWGTVEDTPFRLDVDPVDVNMGPGFVLPPENPRERIAQGLLIEKEKAKKKTKPSTPLLATPAGKTPRSLGGLSPAAQKLASAALGKKVLDGGLRASYSPAPAAHGGGAGATPKLTPRMGTPAATPSRLVTPRKTGPGEDGTSAPAKPGASLTDNLLNL